MTALSFVMMSSYAGNSCDHAFLLRVAFSISHPFFPTLAEHVGGSCGDWWAAGAGAGCECVDVLYYGIDACGLALEHIARRSGLKLVQRTRCVLVFFFVCLCVLGDVCISILLCFGTVAYTLPRAVQCSGTRRRGCIRPCCCCSASLPPPCFSTASCMCVPSSCVPHPLYSLY